MKVIVLGCGTSSGVPMIGCTCPVCRSEDPKNIRTRASVLIQASELNILIDTPQDLRHQAMREGIDRVDAVLYTHTHADHLHGIDDLRSFNFVQHTPIPIYARAEDIEQIRASFAYIFDPKPWGGGKPRLEVHEIDGPFEIGPVHVTPLPIYHGTSKILGFRVGRFAYLTDCGRIPKSTYPLLDGVDVLIIDALRHRPHPTHLSLDEAIKQSKRINAAKTYLTHMTHMFDYWDLRYSLPDGIEPAYDGLTIEVPDG